MRSCPRSPVGIRSILFYTVVCLALVYFSHTSDKHGDLFGQVEESMSLNPDSALALLSEVERVDDLSMREYSGSSMKVG